MVVICPGCGTKYGKLDEKLQGKTAKCKKCGARFVLRDAGEISYELTMKTERIGVIPSAKKPPPPAETVVERQSPVETVYQGMPAETVAHREPDEREGAEDALEITDLSEEEAAAPAEWNTGDKILGLYEVTGLLGEGGMGKVYKVYHHGWNIDLAVKSPKPSELKRAGGAEVFEKEAETWVNLGLHPNTVSCYYVRRLGGIPRVFAEFVDGGSLQEWIRGGKFSDVANALDVAIQFAWGLDYAHKRGLVHQDIKPANVMMTKKGVAKVTDFGLAKARGTNGSGRETEGAPGNELVSFGGMTPAYCSPEQADKKPLSLKTDMWSWALSTLEIFTGEVTWMFGAAAAEALEEYLKNGAARPGAPKMPEAVADLLASCFKKSPDGRPENMLAIAGSLIDIYDSVTGAPYPRTAPKAGGETADSLNNKAISFLDLGRIDDALAIWDSALRTEPNHPESTFNTGMVRWRSSKATDIEIVGQLEEAAKSHWRNSFCEYYLGLVHMERDDCQTAIRTFQTVDQTSPTAQDAKTASAEAAERLDSSRRQLASMEKSAKGITSLALCDDGRTAVSGSDDGSVIIWNMQDGEVVQKFDTGPSPVACAAMDGAGSTIVTGGYRSAALWNAADGTRIRKLGGHPDWVSSASISQDGSVVMTAGWDGAVRIWNARTGDLLNEFEGHAGYATLSPDGASLLFGSEDNTVKLIDMKGGGVKRTFDVFPGAQSISKDGKTLVMADLDNTVILFNAESGETMNIFRGHSAMVTSVALSADGRYLVSSGYDRTLMLWSVKTGRCLRTYEGHEDIVNAVALTPDGNRAVSGGMDKTLRIWSLEPSRPYRAPLMISRVQASEMVLSAAATYEEKLSRMQEALEAGDTVQAAIYIKEARSQLGFRRGSEAVNAWGGLYSRLPRKSLNGGWESKSLAGHKGEVSSVAVSRDGRTALSGGHDRTLRLWDTETGNLVRVMEGHGDRVTSVDLCPDGKWAVSSGGDGSVIFWNTGPDRKPKVMGAHRGAANAVALTYDHAFAVSAGSDGTVRLWDTRTGREIRSLRGHQGAALGVALSRDGRLALSCGEDRTARLWNIATGKPVRVFSGHEDGVTSGAFNQDASKVITASRDTTLLLWDVATARPLQTLKGHTAAVTSVAMSHDGDFAISSDENRAVRFWNLKTGENVRMFSGHSAPVYDVAISPDGRFALSCGADGDIKLWSLDWELEEKSEERWDDGATPYLTHFLTVHTPYSGAIPEGRSPFEKEITRALTRRGKAAYAAKDLEELYYSLGCGGYGWLNRDGVREKLDEMAGSWQGPAPFASAGDADNEREEGFEEGEQIEPEDEKPPQETRKAGVSGFLKNLATGRKKKDKS